MGRWLARLESESCEAAAVVDAARHLDEASPASLRDDIEERAALLEYKGGLTRAEAEKAATLEAMDAGAVEPPQITPGIRYLRPAVEVSAVAYDAHCDSLLAALDPESVEAARLRFAKKKGWVVDRDGERIYTRGR